MTLNTTDLKDGTEMDVFYVKPKDFAACSFDTVEDALEEVRMHLVDGVREVKIVVKEMT
ncbi:MAG: hypothetical protein GTO02_02215, partial [Candidatus Dadabacteria bacterium]|nr:hypothetical protein [Candidatus Dadabacteria bacterium]